jgi:hypothetical protein
MSRTHVWAEDRVRAGDVVKIVDELSPDERLAVNKIRELGDTKILTSQAELLELIAAAARAKADASKMLDLYPYLVPEDMPAKPGWQLANVLVSVVILCAVVALAVQLGKRSPPLPSSGASIGSPAAPQTPIEPPSRQKGRVAPLPPGPRAK